jgi:hypothetical protein
MQSGRFARLGILYEMMGLEIGDHAGIRREVAKNPRFS